MMRRFHVGAARLTAVVLLATLAGCDGAMKGMVRGSGDSVRFNYKMNLYSDDLDVTLPDGESFRGKAVPVGNTRTTSTATQANPEKKDKHAKPVVTHSQSETTTGSAEAVLFGNRGRSMRCNLKYADTGGAIVVGGVGSCTVSDGKVIDVSW